MLRETRIARERQKIFTASPMYVNFMANKVNNLTALRLITLQR